MRLIPRNENALATPLGAPAIGSVTKWRTDADAVTDASGTILYPDRGLLIVRKVAGDISLILTGTVKTGPTVVPVDRNIKPCCQHLPGRPAHYGKLGFVRR